MVELVAVSTELYNNEGRKWLNYETSCRLQSAVQCCIWSHCRLELGTITGQKHNVAKRLFSGTFFCPTVSLKLCYLSLFGQYVESHHDRQNVELVEGWPKLHLVKVNCNCVINGQPTAPTYSKRWINKFTICLWQSDALLRLVHLIQPQLGVTLPFVESNYRLTSSIQSYSVIRQLCSLQTKIL